MRPVPTNSQYTLHKFVLTSAGSSGIQGSAATPQLTGSYFTITNFAAYANLLAVYDQYRIDRVEVRMVLRNNPSGGVSLPRVAYFPDFDDAVAPPTLAAVYSHPRVRQHTFSEAHPEVTFALEPRVAIASYNGAFTGYTAAPGAVFCDSNSSGVQHYGYKAAYENFLDTTQYIDIYYKAWVTMRNPL
jgi:hypothetical protein